MKVAILGDQHFGVRGDSAVFHSYFEKFYTNIFFPYLKKHDIQTVFQLGDMFDKKKNINFYTLSQAKRYFFDPAERMGIEIVCNVGNHDSFYKNSLEINAPDLLTRGYNNVFIIDSPSERDVDGTKFLILPWICRDNERETFELIKETKAQIVLGHLELSGFAMYRGVIEKHGMDPRTFDKFDTVLTGHFHTKSSTGNIHYVGTPYEITWSDYNDQRGFHIFNTDTRELTFIENPYTIFQKIAYDDRGKTLEDILDFDFAKYTDTFVKVVAVDNTNQFALDSFVKALEDNGALDVKVDNNALTLELNDEEIENVEDTLTILLNVVEEVDTSVPKDKLNKLMTDLYLEARQQETV